MWRVPRKRGSVRRSITFDLVTLRERNFHVASIGARMAQAAREKAARTTTRELLAEHFGRPPGLFYTPPSAAFTYSEPNAIEVRIWRIGPGRLDNDGPDDALKNVRDGVADWLGIDDRESGGVDWKRGQQETAPIRSTQGPCPVCLARSGEACREVAGVKLSKGLHAKRRTPWRVRVEVSDLRTPGPDRVVVLASLEPQKSRKSKPRAPKEKAGPGGDEDRTARLLVACPTCRAEVGEACRVALAHGPKTMHHAVHPARAEAAGHVGVKVAPVPAPAGPRGPRKLVKAGSSSVARVALPWCQPECPQCGGTAWLPPRPDCETCRGRGTVGPLKLHLDPKVRPTDRLKLYDVPPAHQARWGATVTLYPRTLRAKGLGTITVFAMKDR